MYHFFIHPVSISFIKTGSNDPSKRPEVVEPEVDLLIPNQWIKYMTDKNIDPLVFPYPNGFPDSSVFKVALSLQYFRVLPANDVILPGHVICDS